MLHLALALLGAFTAAPAAVAGAASVPFEIGEGTRQVNVWGRGEEISRAYFDEHLPGLFERTLVLDEFSPAGGAVEWIFTGERGGLTVVLDGSTVQLYQRYYDSVGYGEQPGVQRGRHPEWRTSPAAVRYEGKLRSVGVIMDHRLMVSISVNGHEVLRQVCPLDASRHQLRLTSHRGHMKGKLVSPAPRSTQVRIDGSRRHQEMIGFGGIATPTAYAELSPEGKRRWWEMVAQYNLLVQREYPIGTQLKPEMDNWDRLADATPHYYGDNFPNGEISDFHYLKTLRRLGGKVWFEFWALPPWVGNDTRKYAQAMVNYCLASQKRAGEPPDVVGIQNERSQTAQMWQQMTLALRQELDRAGLKGVKIHMSDAGSLSGGIQRAKAFRASRQAWAAIDFAASHMYDFQKKFTDPDAFDATLRQWKQLTADRPFLSTELCVNASDYQWPSFRLALSMAQLYHKNLVIADAAAICYCWTLLNIVQPSYGWTRSLCVPDLSNGSVPVASSYQLRTFGAFSRRVREKMVRVEAESSSPDLLASAFIAENAGRTVVLLNRATRPEQVRLAWPNAVFTEMEVVTPYEANAVSSPPKHSDQGIVELTIEPGSIVTLSNVPLGRLPAGFALD